ncbi:MAG TPA: xanthine dehydrogenase family protein subunit M [Lacunisphaera sp.]|jgi:xanthine dehydrogenase YagS FAD-binding subunit
MNPFSYALVEKAEDAVREGAAEGTSYLGGGTNLIDHVKLGVEQPHRLIDVRKIGFDRIESLSGGGLRIGASVSNTTLAYDDRVKTKFPVLSEAILSGASPQLRNVATTAGNLLQRTRCYYFRDGISPCNKRVPGSGCAALHGLNRIHAVLGTSEKCIATHPSDMDVALLALDAVVHLRGVKGERAVPLGEFYVAYGDDPARENVLLPGELITAVDLPATSWFSRSHYFKARERASYEFALSSAAVALDLRDGVVQDCRIALGGVATKPWRAIAAEKVLRGEKPSDEAFARAAATELKSAVPREHNAFKIPLCHRTLVRALQTAAALV